MSLLLLGTDHSTFDLVKYGFFCISPPHTSHSSCHQKLKCLEFDEREMKLNYRSTSDEKGL